MQASKMLRILSRNFPSSMIPQLFYKTASVLLAIVITWALEMSETVSLAASVKSQTECSGHITGHVVTHPHHFC